MSVIRRMVFALLLAFAAQAFADGKFYAPGKPPAGIPYQRALIVFDGEREILLVQSQRPAAEFPTGSPPRSPTDSPTHSPRATDVGWVVPVPAAPEVGTLDAAAADAVFEKLIVEVTSRAAKSPWYVFGFALVFVAAIAWLARRDRLAHRREGRRPALAPYLPAFYFLLPSLAYLVALPPGSYVTSAEENAVSGVAGVFMAFSLVAGLFVWFVHLLVPSWRQSPSRGVALTIGLVPLVTAVFAVLIATLSNVTYTRKGEAPVAAAAPAGVAVLSHVSFGNLDVKVITATPAGDGATVVDWLNANGFTFNGEDVSTFDAYVRGGWVFAVARVPPDLNPPENRRGTLTPPLLLRFPAKEAVYPLALTATGGATTQIDLYTLTTFKTVNALYPRQYHAAPLRRITSAGELLAGARTTGWLPRERWRENWAGYYAMNPSPEQMKEGDLIISPTGERPRHPAAGIAR